MKLSCPGLTDLTFNAPGSGLVCRSLDLGWPEPRDVVSPRPLADGTDDDTTYAGPRAVALACVIHNGTIGTRAQIRDRLASFCHPSLRPTLWYPASMLAGAADDRMIGLRPVQGQALVDNTVTSEVMVQFTAPSGLIEATTATTVDVPALPPADGEAFDWVWPVSWPAASPTPVVATSAGSMAAWPTIRVDGPCVGPVIANGTLALSFPGLDVPAGEYLLIDAWARTVLLNGVTDRRSWLDPVASVWWQIQPGGNDLFYLPESSGPPSEASVTWRDTYFL